MGMRGSQPGSKQKIVVYAMIMNQETKSQFFKQRLCFGVDVSVYR